MPQQVQANNVTTVSLYADDKFIDCHLAPLHEDLIQ